mgnify:CR=1 FL=1
MKAFFIKRTALLNAGVSKTWAGKRDIYSIQFGCKKCSNHSLQRTGLTAPLVLRTECGLHTLIHTFASEIPLQYFGANLENAECLAPLFFFPTSGADLLVGKV